MFRVVVMIILVLCVIAGGSYVVLNKDSRWGQKLQHTLLEQQAYQALQDKDWAQAQPLLETLYQANPNNPDIARQLAQTYLQQSKSFTESHPEHALEKYQQADTLFQQALKTHPTHIPLILGYSEFLLNDASRLNDAVQALNTGLKSSPHHPELLSMLASVYQHAASNTLEDRPEMIAWLESWSRYYARLAIKYHPDLFATRFKLGLLEQNRALNPFQEQSIDHLVRAARQYCNALLIEPKHIQSRYNLGLTLVNLNAVEEGFEQLNAVKQMALNDNHVAQAQELAVEIQGIHNSVFNGDASTHTVSERLDDLLHQCLLDPRMDTADPNSKRTGDKAP